MESYAMNWMKRITVIFLGSFKTWINYYPPDNVNRDFLES